MTVSQNLAVTRHLDSFISTLVTQESHAGLNGDLLHLTGNPIPNDTDKIEYKRFDKDAGFRAIDTRKSASDPEGVEIDFGGEEATAVLESNGAHTKPYEVQGRSPDAIWGDVQAAAVAGTNAMLLSRLNAAVTAINTSATAPAAIDLTNAATEAVRLLQAAVNTAMLASGGYCDIHLLWDPSALDYFSAHAKVQSRLSGGATAGAPSTPTLEAIDRLIGKGTVSRLCKAAYTSTKRGQTVTNSFLLSNTVYIAAVSRNPNKADPSALKLITGLGSPMTPLFYKTDATGTHEKAKWHWKETLLVPNAGALVKQAFTV